MQGEESYERLLESSLNSVIASVRGMSNDKLQDLLSSDEIIDAMITALPEVRALPSQRDTGFAKNLQLVEENLAYSAHIERMKANVSSLSEKALNLKTEVDRMKAQLDVVNASNTIDMTVNLLEIALTDVDDDAENLASNFCSGRIPVDSFVQQFQEKKTLSQMRRVKCNRLKDVLNAQHYRTSPVSRQTLYPDAAHISKPSHYSFY